MHAAVGRTVDAAWGQAHIDTALYRCYDRNFLWAHGGDARVDASVLDAEGRRLLGGAGLPHRRVVVEDPLGRVLMPGFAALGYGAECHVIMAHASAERSSWPSPEQDLCEIGRDELAEAYDRWLRTDPALRAVSDEDVRSHLVEHQRGYGSAGAHERIIAARVDGEVVAWAKAWSRDGVGQVEDVVCLHDHRGKGLGRAVVAGATRAALEAAPELLFIVADDNDWPKQLYSRLGYEQVGLRRVFTLG
jgi:ribosomal protein S18 acetylase RimI-like enzyme